MSDNSFKPYELDPNYRAIADHIGIDAFNKLVWLCGGEVLYIPKNDKKWRLERNRRIAEDYCGGNSRALARKYGLSERRIQQIVNEERGVQ